MKKLFLPYGEYTIQWSTDGYYTSYQNVEVMEEERFVKEWLVPRLEENTLTVNYLKQMTYDLKGVKIKSIHIIYPRRQRDGGRYQMAG